MILLVQSAEEEQFLHGLFCLIIISTSSSMDVILHGLKGLFHGLSIVLPLRLGAFV